MRRLAAASTRLHSRAAEVRLPVCAQATASLMETKSKRAMLMGWGVRRALRVAGGIDAVGLRLDGMVIVVHGRTDLGMLPGGIAVVRVNATRVVIVPVGQVS